MDPALIIVLLVMTAVALFILPPLLRGDAGTESPASNRSVDSMAEAASRRDSSYEALADLEFDFASGKISPEEFAALKTQYQKAAVTALKHLEDLQGGEQAGGPAPGKGTGVP